MTDWPNETPDDLRKKIYDVMGCRSYGPADIWGVVKEWLETEGIEAPASLN